MKYGASKLRFPHAKYFLRRLSAVWAHALKKVRHPCPRVPQKLKNVGYKIGRQIIHTVKYADDLVLLTKEENVLQKMIDKLIEIGGSYGMEMNVEKTKVMRISRQPFPVKNYDRPKTTTECGIF